MDKDKSSHNSANRLPPSGRYDIFASSNAGYSINTEKAGSSNLPPLRPGTSSEHGGYFGHDLPSDSAQFSHDLSRMPENPPKNLGHRRAHSEILMLPDDLNFDSDLGFVGGFDGPSFSDETEEDLFSMYMDMDKVNSTSATSGFLVGGDSSASLTAEPGSSTAHAQPQANQGADNVAVASSYKPRTRHQHSQSMDGSSSIIPEMLMSGSEELSAADSKKAASAANLAELALVDPKRAKRIWANRQSAARSKERKMRYIAELERKIQTLQTEATSMSAQLTLLQRDTNGLTSENSELKLRVQTMEQQVHLQDALNDALKDEIQHLKALTGQPIPNGVPMNYPGPYGASHQPFYASSNNHAMHTMLTAQQLQQLQISSQNQQQYQLHPLQQQHMHQPRPSLQQQQQHHHHHQEQRIQTSGEVKVRISAPPSVQKDLGPADGSLSSKD